MTRPKKNHDESFLSILHTADTSGSSIFQYLNKKKATEAGHALQDLRTQVLESEQRRRMLQHALRLADLEQNVLKDQLARCTSLISPVRRLPPEILRQIFLYFTDSASGPLVESINQAFYAPWILGQVCSFWRSIVRSYPDLWGAVCIDMQASKAQCHFSTAYLEDTYLYSGQVPLRVDLNLKSNTKRSSVIMLLKSSARWQELHFREFSETFIHPIYLPLLRTLHIWSNLDNLEMFSSAPLLEEVQILSEAPASGLNIPWKQIISFSTNRYLDMNDLDLTLRQAPRLRKVALLRQNVRHMPWGLLPETDVVHTSIRCIFLETPYPLSFLTFPALESFSLHLPVELQFDPLAQNIARDILDMRCRSLCTLTIVSIQNIPFDSEHMLHFLILTPTIRDLTLAGAGWCSSQPGNDQIANPVETIFGGMVAQFDSLPYRALQQKERTDFHYDWNRPLLPALESLEITIEGEAAVTVLGDAFMSMVIVRFRLRQNLPLRHISIKIAQSVHFPRIEFCDLCELVIVRDQGLGIQLVLSGESDLTLAPACL